MFLRFVCVPCFDDYFCTCSVFFIFSVSAFLVCVLFLRCNVFLCVCDCVCLCVCVCVYVCLCVCLCGLLCVILFLLGVLRCVCVCVSVLYVFLF